MLLPLDFITDTIYISKGSNECLLLVEVITDIKPEQIEIINKWKEFIENKENIPHYKQTQHLFIMNSYHLLSNKLCKDFYKRNPFTINIKTTLKFSCIRELVRKRIRVLGKDKKLIVIKLGIQDDLKDLKGNKDKRVIIYNSNNVLNPPLSFIIAHTYSYMNRDNKFLPLIEYS